MIRKRKRILYGGSIGTATFIVGCALLFYALEFETVYSMEPWRAALWSYISSHGIVLEPTAQQSPLLESNADTIPRTALTQVYPAILIYAGSLLTIYQIDYREKSLLNLVRNGASVLYGYVGFGLIAIAESGASPAVAGGIFIITLIAIPAYIGGRFLSALPFVGLASFGLMASIGLLIFLIGISILTTILPLIAIGGVAVASAALTVWLLKKVPR